MPGIYNEAVILDKSIRLVGKPSGEKRVIVETSQQPALTVHGAGARCEGMEVKRVSDRSNFNLSTFSN